VEKYEVNGRWWVKMGIGGGAEDELTRLVAGLEERIEKPEDAYGRMTSAPVVPQIEDLTLNGSHLRPNRRLGILALMRVLLDRVDTCGQGQDLLDGRQRRRQSARRM